MGAEDELCCRKEGKRKGKRIEKFSFALRLSEENEKTTTMGPCGLRAWGLPEPDPGPRPVASLDGA